MDGLINENKKDLSLKIGALQKISPNNDKVYIFLGELANRLVSAGDVVHGGAAITAPTTSGIFADYVIREEDTKALEKINNFYSEYVES